MNFLELIGRMHIFAADPVIERQRDQSDYLVYTFRKYKTRLKGAGYYSHSKY
jgi:hypothetical protein